MVLGDIIMIGLLDNVQVSVQTMEQAQLRNSDSKFIFKMKGMPQIAGKINTNIVWYRGVRILKLVAKNVKKIQDFFDIQ